MAWTAPRTWVDGVVVTAALLNEQIRDNLNETMCAKARQRGGFFVTLEAEDVDTDSDNNTSIVERHCASQRIATAAQATPGDTNFTEISSGGVDSLGPSVTVETGQQALVAMSCSISNTASAGLGVMSWGVSGATNRPTYFDPISLMQDGAKQSGAYWNFSNIDHMKGLVPGVNTFTCQYRSGGLGTVTFRNRFLAVWPL